LQLRRRLRKEFADELEMLRATPGAFSARPSRLVLTGESGAQFVSFTADNVAAGIVDRPDRAIAAEELRWSAKGAGLDIAEIRCIDRRLCGGIVCSPVSPHADGWIPIAWLWECRGSRHARLCQC
jgi:hypothetical protein